MTLDQIQGLKGPVLILPNHPGYIDPALVLAALAAGAALVRGRLT
jgi:1-acyl-sn-glycerol-3-phosphate acyltransferase